jgi:stage V sporulation protein D (sporulation-specific penicillin-binding protein)
MMARASKHAHWRSDSSRKIRDPRIMLLMIVVLFAWGALVARLYVVQVRDHEWYRSLALGQRELFSRLYPERGEILVRDQRHPDGWFPIATNEETFTIYAVPQDIEDPKGVARALIAALPEEDASASEDDGTEEDAEDQPTREERMIAQLSKTDDPYEPIALQVSSSVREQVMALGLDGVAAASSITRYYPDGAKMAHLTGFVGSDKDGKSGRYGIEGKYDENLAGSQGLLTGERDPVGRLIAFGKRDITRAEDGASIYLTIEREVQLEVCRLLSDAVAEHGATGGSVVILHPRTGAVRAMCSVPSYDPNSYESAESVALFSNPIISDAYEPGSVFKPLTMSAAIAGGAVTPQTSYEDTGSLTIGGFTITNTNYETHGKSTMIEVLQKSINTGSVFAAQALGRNKFRATIERYGFGARTGIQLASESPGDVANLAKREPVYLATASFGQGITSTLLQLTAAFAAIANGGTLMQPYVVDSVAEVNGGRRQIEPRAVHEVIDMRTATLLQGMLVSVVREGHPKRAGVPGYYIGGKTGTAQIPLTDRAGYSKDTIHSFIGFGPVESPTFAMGVRINRPQRRFADATAAPLFGTIAKFLVQFDRIPPRE